LPVLYLRIFGCISRQRAASEVIDAGQNRPIHPRKILRGTKYRACRTALAGWLADCPDNPKSCIM
ncbi:MAG TPA: hypothetical protein VF117_01070, partial [Gammaproteobacteria bacterium]